jgi:uncharacterized delta-60 repeat protein
VRYTADGVLDTSFGGGDGIVTTPVGNGYDSAAGAAIDSAGRIVVAGSSYRVDQYDFVVARYTSTGVLDASFGTGGIVTTDFGLGSSLAEGVAVDSDDRIVAVGAAYNGSDYVFAVARYNTDGSLAGGATTDIGPSSDLAYAVAVDLQGRIVVSGRSSDGISDDFAVARYNTGLPWPGISLDASFSDDGYLTTTFLPASGDGNDRAYGIAVDSAGRIVVGGYSDDHFSVARYTTDGALDVNFGAGGKARTYFESSDGGQGFGIAIDSAGRIVVGGENSDDFAVVRYAGASVSGSPSGVAGVSGDGEVALSWSAPAVMGGAAVTDYVVEYSSDGGVSWSTFADGTSASTSAVVTGLSNGVGYVFRVSAVNIAGTGSVSVVSASVTPAPAGCTIVGTPGDDVLVGTGGADHICGFGGNDRIYGKAGDDVLDGGSGNDKLYGGKGKDRLYGRGGADVLKGGPGNDKLYGNGGRDRLYGQAGNDRLVGGSNRDKLYGQGGRDKLFGGKARDLLVGGAKKDKLDGGKGKDTAKKPGPDVLVSIEIVVP